MTDLYSEWRDFYAEKVRSWMSLEELRAECGKLQTVDNPSPEVLLVHAMHALEELQADAARLQCVLDRVPVSELNESLDAEMERYERAPTLDEFRAAIDAAMQASRKGDSEFGPVTEAELDAARVTIFPTILRRIK